MFFIHIYRIILISFCIPFAAIQGAIVNVPTMSAAFAKAAGSVAAYQAKSFMECITEGKQFKEAIASQVGQASTSSTNLSSQLTEIKEVDKPVIVPLIITAIAFVTVIALSIKMNSQSQKIDKIDTQDLDVEKAKFYGFCRPMCSSNR